MVFLNCVAFRHFGAADRQSQELVLLTGVLPGMHLSDKPTLLMALIIFTAALEVIHSISKHF